MENIDHQPVYGKRPREMNESLEVRAFKHLNIENSENINRNKKKKHKKHKKHKSKRKNKEKENHSEFNGVAGLALLLARMCDTTHCLSATDSEKMLSERIHSEANGFKSIKMRTKYIPTPIWIWHSDSYDNIGKALAEKQNTDFLFMKKQLETYGNWNHKSFVEKYLVITTYKIQKMNQEESLHRGVLLKNAQKHLVCKCDYEMF